MINWFKNSSIAVKLIVVGVVIVALLFILSFVGGWSSGVKSWWNDRQYEKTMEKDAEYQKTINDLKAKNVELDKKLVEAVAKNEILVQTDKNLEAKAKAEQAKLDEALSAQDAEEARTEESIDNRTRCERVKAKMIALGSKTAGEINCEQVK
jgi:predicted negative regulator of RcsB-dependent stress response